MNGELITYLESNVDGKKLVNNLEKIKENATNILAKIIEVFPDYTPHDIEHKKRVLKRIELLIPDSLAKQMNIYEIYFLIAATYLHDIGMTNLPELQIPEEFNDSEKIAKYIRENHHERTEKFVIDNFQKFGIDDIHQARIIGRIARGHRKDNLQDSSLYESDRMYGTNNSINMPLLASLLRIGDELDLTFERTPMIIYEHKPPKDEISKAEWIRHIETSGVGISKEDSLILKCDATCSESKIHRSLKRLQDKINEELDDLPNHLHYYRNCRKDIPRKFIMNITPIDYEEYDLKFSLKEKAIVDLLMGEKLYKEKDESVRELIKNSLDGCRLLLDEIKEKQNYFPEIIISYFPNKSRLEISDNGIGMDEEKIERYFTKIGQSFYNSSEFNEEQHGFTPVSELGIGILSCFMLADRIIVNTKKNGSAPLSIEIDDISDYFIVKKGTREISGTTVILELKKTVQENFDIIEIVEKYARHLEIPIKVKVDDLEKIVTGRPNLPDIREVVDMYHDNFKFHICKIDNELVKGYIAFFGANIESSWMPIEQYRSREFKLKEREISIEGIFVSNENILPPYLATEYIQSDLNIRNKAIDINVARNEIVHNKKLEIFKESIEDILIKEIYDFIAAIEKNCIEKNLDIRKILSNFFNSFISFWGIDKFQRGSKTYKNITELITKFYHIKYFSNGEIHYDTAENILNSGKHITILNIYTNEKMDDYIIHILKHANEFNESDIFITKDYHITNLIFPFNPNKITRSDISEIKWKAKENLVKVIPKTWRLAEFSNYTSALFLEDFIGPGSTINYSNKFAKLLTDNSDLLEKQNFSMIVEGFFKTLRMNLKGNFNKILDQQHEILGLLIKEKRIAQEDSEKFILTKEDFPKHLIK